MADRTCLKQALLATLLACSCLVSWAATKGPDAGGYTATDSTVHGFVDVSATGASVLSGTDDGTAVLILPFAFQFYGRSYTMVCASTNGALYFIKTRDRAADSMISRVPISPLRRRRAIFTQFCLSGATLHFSNRALDRSFMRLQVLRAVAGSSSSGTMHILKDPRIRWRIRWFCPRTRIPFCFSTIPSTSDRVTQPVREGRLQ